MTQRVRAFRDGKLLATGSLAEVAQTLAATGQTEALVLDEAEGRVVDLDLSGGAEAIAARYAPAPRGPGRPKLGVTAREVTLLPRHWDWLARQPGGASATLRRLVELARQSPEARARHAQERAYRAMQALAGDLPGYEEALRALFAGDTDGFAARIKPWPEDIRTFALDLATGGVDD